VSRLCRTLLLEVHFSRESFGATVQRLGSSGSPVSGGTPGGFGAPGGSYGLPGYPGGKLGCGGIAGSRIGGLGGIELLYFMIRFTLLSANRGGFRYSTPQVCVHSGRADRCR
jgi:hypothetical protein